MIIKFVGSRDLFPDIVHDKTDYDFLVLMTNWRAFWTRILLFTLGFRRRYGDNYSSSWAVALQLKGFQVWKNSNIDILLTTDTNFFSDYMIAHEEVRIKQLKNKAERLVVFQRVLYNRTVTIEKMQEYLDNKFIDRGF